MSVLTPPKIAATREQFYFENADWELCRKILDTNPTRRMRLSYANGRLFIMSPLPMHESWKELIDTLIKDLCSELDIDRRSMGSTTWLKESAKHGIESDECYYIASEPLIRGKTEFDLTRDPPPDLAVEVDVTHSPVDRKAIYEALGVPELWIYDGKRLAFLHLIDGHYESKPTSLSFPMITPADVERHLNMMPTQSETAIVREWRKFIRSKQGAK